MTEKQDSIQPRERDAVEGRRKREERERERNAGEK